MAPKTTRKGGKKASKGGDKHECPAIVKAEAEAEADDDVEGETQHEVEAGSGRKHEKRRTSMRDASAPAGDSEGDVGRDAASKIGGGGGGAAVAALAVDVVTYKSVISSMVRANASDFIEEENYYLLQWLYRIRRVSCARGIRAGFLQPDFLWSIYRPMMRSRKMRRTIGEIKVAVNLWCIYRASAEERYGHISDWDVSSITDMSHLFYGTSDFNDDISRWDVSNVTDMSSMFCHAAAFNQPVGDWDVSKVTGMSWMFANAHAFNQPIGDWVVSKVTNMSCMFCYASAFNQDLTRWDVQSVTNTHGMFAGAPAMQRNNKPDHVTSREDR